MIVEHKTIVITGVGPGLGREIAACSLRDGANEDHAAILDALERRDVEAAVKAIEKHLRTSIVAFEADENNVG